MGEGNEGEDRLPRGRQAVSPWQVLRRPLLFLVVFFALTVPIIGLFGGWAPAYRDGQHLDEVPVGQEAQTTPLAFTVREATWVHTKYSFPERDVNELHLVVRVRTTQDSAVIGGFLDSVVSARFRGIDLPAGENFHSNADTTDGSFGRGLFTRVIDENLAEIIQPRLSQDVHVLWRLPDTVDTTQPVDVTFKGCVWRKSTLDDSWGWRDCRPQVVVHLDHIETDNRIRTPVGEKTPQGGAS